MRGFIGKLDGRLEQSYRELGMYFSRDPQTKLLVNILSCCDLETEFTKCNLQKRKNVVEVECLISLLGLNDNSMQV